MALKATRERLIADYTLLERTNISVNNILKLLKFTLKSSYFQVNGDQYKQVVGCVIGFSMSGVMANIIMEDVEEKALITTPNPLKWWYRFVDDNRSCMKQKHVEEFQQLLNSINPQIQFTCKPATFLSLTP